MLKEIILEKSYKDDFVKMKELRAEVVSFFNESVWIESMAKYSQHIRVGVFLKKHFLLP